MRLLTAVLLLLSVPAVAGTNTWSTNGPNGGIIWEIEFDRVNPSLAYAATDGALFKSSNGGATWSVVSGAPSGTTVTAVEIHPTNPAIIYVATNTKGVWKTADAGTTWSRVSTGLRTSSYYPNEYEEVLSLAVDPANPSIIYAGTRKDRVYKTSDGGANWAATGTLPQIPVYSLAVDPNAQNTVYAGLNSSVGLNVNDGVYKSTDAGGTWTAANTGLATTAGKKLIWDIEIDSSSNPSTLYAASDAGGLFKSTNGAASWSAVNTNSGVAAFTEAYAVEVAPSSPSTVFVGSYDRMYKSINGGSSWTEQTTGISGFFYAALAVDPTDPLKVATGNNTDLFRTSDSGATWSTASISGGAIDSIAYNAATGSLVGIGRDAVYRSTNNGASWTRVSRFEGRTVGELVAHNGVLYAVTWEPGCRSDERTGAKFARSTDDGATWTFTHLSTSGRGRSIAVHPANPNIIFITTTFPYAGTESEILKSTDGGATWSGVFPPFGLSGDAPIAVHPTNPSIVYAGGEGNSFWKSTDGGTTWTKKTGGLPPGGFMYSPVSIAIDPANPNRVVVGSIVYFYDSTDAGETWVQRTVVNTTTVTSPYGELYGTSVAFDPVTSGTIYVSTARYGIFRSTNNGQTWAAFSSGLYDTRVEKIITGASGYLHAATEGSGIFDYYTPTVAPAPVLTATRYFSVARGAQGPTVAVSWTNPGGATSFELQRGTSLSGAFTTLATVTGTSYEDYLGSLPPVQTLLYRVRATGTSQYSNVDYTVIYFFTDDPLISGETIVKAVHLTQAREAVNLLRAAANLTASTWTDPSPAGMPMKTVHVTELRSALAPALAAFGVTKTYTDPTLTSGSPFKAAHIQQIWDAVK